MSSFSKELESLLIKEQFLVSKRVIDMFGASHGGSDSEISPNFLADLKTELYRLKDRLLRSQDSFKNAIKPMHAQFEIFLSNNSRIIQPTESVGGKSTSVKKAPSKVRKESKGQLVQKHSERSLRSSDRTILSSTSGNPLDIWVKSSPFFAPLPTTDDINKMFSIKSDRNSSEPNFELIVKGTKKHWSETMMERVKSLIKDTRKFPKLLMPPGPPPSPYDRSEFWNTNSCPFPIENAHKFNCDTIHCLLSSLVEVDTQTRKMKTSNNEVLYLPLNVLAPSIESEKYLCFPFTSRLGFELESIGLNKNESMINTKEDAFSSDIENLRKNIEEIEPRLEELKRSILKQLMKFSEDEERRIMEQTELNDLLQNVGSKKRKR